MKHCITTDCYSDRQKRLKAPTLYGFRIIVWYGPGPGQHLPTIFSRDIPEQWATLKNDPTVVTAILKKRKREIDRYARVVYAE